MGKRQKVAAIGRPSDGVDDGEDYSSSDVELSDGEDYSSPDLSSDELSDDPPYVLPRATATGKAKATAQRKAKAPGKAKATGNRKVTAKGKGSGSGKRTTKAAQSAAMQQRLEAAQQRLEAAQQVQGAAPRDSVLHATPF